MSSSEGKFLHESLQDRKSIKSLLEALTKAIGKGEVVLSDGDDELTLPVDKLLTLRIKANRSNGNCVIGVKLSWAEEIRLPKAQSNPTIR